MESSPRADIGCWLALLDRASLFYRRQMQSDDSETEVVPVEVRLIGTERVTGKGDLQVLAVVELEIAGVVLRVQGIQIVRNRITGQRTVKPPQFRGNDGQRYLALLCPGPYAGHLRSSGGVAS